MKAVWFERQGSLDAVEYGALPDPELNADEVMVKVHAVALNGFEPMMVLGTTKLRTPLPMIPCGDIVGEIVEIGSSVPGKRWNVGDRVLIKPASAKGMMGETVPGGAREYVPIDAQQLIPIPDNVSYVDAACTTVAYSTAYRLITARGKISAGERVLILGSTGGVGVACVQFALQAGAEVIACGSMQWKLQKLRDLGASAVIDTSATDFLEFIHQCYGRPRVDGQGGIDVVVNYIGGDTWVRSLKVLKRQGRLLTCGASAGYDPQTDIRYIWSFELNIIGSDGWSAEDPVTLLAMMAVGKLKPVIHDVLPFSEARQAIKQLADRKVFGKLVLTP